MDETSQPPLNVALDKLEDEYGLNPDPQAIADSFTNWVKSTGKEMYPHQEASLIGIVSGEHLIVSTPTGSGKSLIAMQALFTALATNRTAYYTAPLKALVSEKFFELISLFGAHNVGMVTGDSAINANAPIICATAEILANIALREGENADCQMVIMDEFHFYADPQRGWAWQVPLLELPQAQQILLSATLGDTSFFIKDLERRTGRSVSIIDDAKRPVPLHYSWSAEPLGEFIHGLVKTHMAPVYVVHFTQREAVQTAQSLLAINLISKSQKNNIADALGDFKFGNGFGKILSKLLRAGIGVHHAGLLPRYRRLVERLAQAGLLNVICGTDTLGVGINVPIRSVLFTSLVKFDGNKMRHLSAREFHQIAGRAGRAGYDTVGYVIAQAPEHEIENARRVRKTGDDPIKLKRVQRVKPEPGKLQWSEKTFNQLITKEPAALTSQLHVNHALILNLLQRPDPVTATKNLLTNNHCPPAERNLLVRKALDIYTSLRLAEVIVHHDREWRNAHPNESAIAFAKEVPSDFALNAPLSPFALSALDLLDKNDVAYALDVVSIIEAVQEDPTPLLIAQKKELSGALINRLKTEGLSYNQRMQVVDEVTYPQPLKELLTPALEIYAQSNPWVKEYELRPKSVVRMMIEEALTFSELISRFHLERSEGLLLRYLTDTYRALRQIVPLDARTPELIDVITWLGNLVRAIDSSLLDEWEALANGTALAGTDNAISGTEAIFGADENGKINFSRNTHSLRKNIRNAMFQRIEAIARDDLDLLVELDGNTGWDANTWADAIDDYFAEYDYLGTDTAARSDKFFQILTDPTLGDLLQAGVAEAEAFALLETHGTGRLWLVKQILDDGQDDGDWALYALVDLEKSDEINELSMRIINFDIV